MCKEIVSKTERCQKAQNKTARSTSKAFNFHLPTLGFPRPDIYSEDMGAFFALNLKYNVSRGISITLVLYMSEYIYKLEKVSFKIG